MYTSVSECNRGTPLDSYLFIIVGATLQNILAYPLPKLFWLIYRFIYIFKKAVKVST